MPCDVITVCRFQCYFSLGLCHFPRGFANIFFRLCHLPCDVDGGAKNSCVSKKSFAESSGFVSSKGKRLSGVERSEVFEIEGIKIFWSRKEKGFVKLKGERFC